MKPAHWARVAKRLREKYQLSWNQAKATYAKLKAKADRKPSLRMVAELPKRLPAKYKESVKTAKPAIAKKPESLRLPKGIKLAPPPPPPAQPADVPKRQPARNNFEQLLRDRGLPVRAIARGGMGKEIAAMWREPELQRKLANQLEIGFNQIRRKGRMKAHTKDRVERILLDLFGENRYKIAWHAILRELYGSPAKGKIA